MTKCSDCPPDFEPKKSGTMTEIKDGNKIHFDIERQVCLTQTNRPDKFLVLQELKFNNGEKEIRIGYYVRIKKEGKKAFCQKKYGLISEHRYFPGVRFDFAF